MFKSRTYHDQQIYAVSQVLLYSCTYNHPNRYKSFTCSSGYNHSTLTLALFVNTVTAHAYVISAVVTKRTNFNDVNKKSLNILVSLL